MCGDATDSGNVDMLMEAKADLIFTDPPYNMAYTGHKNNPRAKILNDNLGDGFGQFITDSLTNMVNNSKVSAPYYVFTHEKELGTIRQSFIDSGIIPSQTIIWKKDHMTLGGSDYQHKFEPIVYGWKSHKERYIIKDRSLTDVWEIPRPITSKEHPTMKPIELIVYAIRNSSKADDIVMDTFLGSGSTLIACEQTDRVCYGMELDPKYVDVIRKRYWKFINNNNEEGWEEGTK